MAERDLRRKLFWLIAIRVGISSLLLGSAVFVQITSPGTIPGESLFLLIGVTYALNILWTLTLKWAERHRWIVDIQLACDALIVSAFIAVTGGITSYFAALYVLPIAAASSVQFRRGGMMIATLSALLYLGIVLTQYFGLAGLLGIPLIAREGILPPLRIVAYTAGLNVFLFFSIAFLSGSLADRLQRAGARLERASSEIADLQAFNQHVIDSLSSGLATTDRQGRILTFNRAAEAITGHPAYSVVGRRLEEVLELPPNVSGELAHLSDPSRGRRIETSYRTGDGRQIELGFTATPLQTPGGNAGLLFAFQDVTDIKKLERDARLRQRLAAVGEMAAGIAHEIRNPLASMSGSIQILRQELPLTDEQAQLMDIVLRESERLNDTIRSFLAYARPQRFSIARLDVRRVLNDAALLLRNSSEVLDGHVIDVHVPPTEVAFEADENQIRQIVWNLATNGLRAMRTGGRLSLGARIDPGSGASPDTVVLDVSDEGVGIPAEELDAIFQPFRGTFSKGTGLGLAIVHRIVSDYGGEIHVSSSPGKGTTVSVRLPVKSGTAVKVESGK
ncbi:MAG TPA: ATP-binding protein [Vicinamibacterales bacterium]|nr:ATP-binding protein [Vicinamibacterales bacterium]